MISQKSFGVVYIDRRIWITAKFLPGSLNHVADGKSRKFRDELEWKLDTEVFELLCTRYGKPGVDLFASCLNAEVDKYVSWFPDPGAMATDAFSIYWKEVYFYAFPPFCLISRCFDKIENENAEGFMVPVVPWWPTQTWFPRLLSLLIEEPVMLPLTTSI